MWFWKYVSMQKLMRSHKRSAINMSYLLAQILTTKKPVDSVPRCKIAIWIPHLEEVVVGGLSWIN